MLSTYKVRDAYALLDTQVLNALLLTNPHVMLSAMVAPVITPMSASNA